MRYSRKLASLLALSLGGCPGATPGDDTGGSTSATASTSASSSTSAGSPTSGPGSTGVTTSGTTTTGVTTSGTSISGSTSDGSSTTFEGTTTGDDTDGPIDVTCTYPGSTSDGPLSPDVAPECACVDENGNLTCGPALCPAISGGCSDGIGFEEECHGEWSYNEAALDCALVAARDGALGTIRWYFSPNSGFSDHGGFLHILGERRAIRQDVDWVDLCGEVSETQVWQLKDPAYFQGCIDLPTFCARLACFFAGTEGHALSLCMPSDYVCDA